MLPRLILLSFMFTNLAWAGEGFFERPLAPAAVDQAWESVFAIVVRTDELESIGTGFVVDVNSAAHEVTLLTNRHVVIWRDAKWTSIIVAQNASFRGERPLLTEYAYGIVSTRVRIARSSKNPDLALLTLTVPPGQPLPRPLRIASNCEVSMDRDLYSIGFSETAQRESVNHRPIADQDSARKRWSKGRFVKYGTEERDGLLYLADTTVDLLHGGSGGPLLNSAGELIGVMDFDFASKQTKFAYVGDETTMPPKAHSSTVRCEEMRSFVNHAPSVFDHQIWTDQD